MIENTPCKMELYDMKGALICNAEHLLSKGFHSAEFHLPVGLHKGLYLFKITSNNNSLVKKIIIE
jgi:hypothetical protein